LEIAEGSLLSMIELFVVLRFGLLAYAVAWFVFLVLLGAPLTLDFSRGYAGRSLFIIALCLGLAFYGFRAALAGRPVFGNLAVDD
jgi:hypothetical protein